MNEKIQNQLTSLLEWAESATKTGANFVAEQTPLYISELLAYNFWLSLSYFVISVLLIVISCVGIYKFLIYSIKQKDLENNMPFVMLFLIPVAIAVEGMRVNQEWIKIYLAPRLFVVDYLREELNK
jgi:hypothetical protein